MGLDANRPLGGLKVIESSLLGPGLVATFLADLGADVVKVEPPSGDYIRQMTWPIVDGTSLLHLHTHRGKRSIALDLKTDDGLGIYRDLVREADVVVEAMRPGSLARLGIGFDDLVAVNPQLVFCSVSGYGATGPYRDMPSHGIAYDTWAGLIEPAVDDKGFTRIPTLPNIGINVGPLIGALGILAAVLRARETGKGTWLEVAQSDAAAYMDWYRIETYRAYDRPADVVTGNAADDYERREPGLAGMWEGVRYQIYEASDGYVLFMASEQAFWRNFCEGVHRRAPSARGPGPPPPAPARHNTELQTELKAIFATRTCTEWLDFSNEANTPIAPVNTPRTAPDDPQFSHRLPFYGIEDVGAEQLPLPIYLEGELPPTPTMAPRVGEQTDEVLAELGLSPERIAELRASGAVGPREG